MTTNISFAGQPSPDPRPVAVVLGGTVPHRELLANLGRRGYKTVLVDYLEDPPARKDADLHVRESTLDRNMVLDIARKMNARLVISTCIDQAGVIACQVAEEMGLPQPYSYETARKVTDKARMKQIMADNGIPTSAFRVYDDMQEALKTDLEFPVVVKPADGNSSKGVRKALNPGELEAFLELAFRVSRNGKVIVESYVEGLEIGMDCFVHDTRVSVLMCHRKRKPGGDGSKVIFSIGSVSPPEISSTAHENLRKAAARVADVFGLNNTPLLMQAIVTGDEVHVVEFAPRIGGGLNFRTIKLFTGFDIIDAAVDSYLGVPVKVQYSKPLFYHSENHVYTKPGVFGSIEGYQELLHDGTIEEFYPNKTRGMAVSSDMASNDRAASFFVKAFSIETLRQKVRKSFDSIKVYDIKGNLMFNDSFYQDLLF